MSLKKKVSFPSLLMLFSTWGCVWFSSFALLWLIKRTLNIFQADEVKYSNSFMILCDNCEIKRTHFFCYSPLENVADRPNESGVLTLAPESEMTDEVAAGALHFLHTCLFKQHFVLLRLVWHLKQVMEVTIWQTKPGEFVQNQMG